MILTRIASLARSRTWLAALLAVAMTASASNAQAQDWTPGRYMRQAMERVMTWTMEIDRDSSYGYTDDGICLWGAFIRQNETCGFERSFRWGQNYIVIVDGDSDTRDIDLEILDDRGRVVAEDTSTDRTARIDFSPQFTGDYVVRVKLYDAADNSFCAVAVLEDGGINVPKVNVSTVLDRFFDSAERIAELGSNDGLSTGFLVENNQATIYGSLLSGGEDDWVNNITLGNGRVAMLAEGDTQVQDIDLHLHDARGDLLDEDIALDAYPRIFWDARGGRTYSLRVDNAAGGSPRTFVLFGILQMHN